MWWHHLRLDYTNQRHMASGFSYWEGKSSAVYNTAILTKQKGFHNFFKTAIPLNYKAYFSNVTDLYQPTGRQASSLHFTGVLYLPHNDENHFIGKYLLRITQSYLYHTGTSPLMSCLPLLTHVELLPPCTPFLPSRTSSFTPHSAFATKSLYKNTLYSLLKTNSWWPQEKVATSFQTCFCTHRSDTSHRSLSATDRTAQTQPSIFWWHCTSPPAHWKLL